MTKLLIILGVVAAAFVVWYVVRAPATTPTPTVTPGASGTPSPTSQAATPTATAKPSSASVTISGFAFNPATVTVAVGGSVTWTNRDNTPHTVTGGAGSVISSPTLGTGLSYTATFTKAGTYAYHCSIHPSMTGTVVVR